MNAVSDDGSTALMCAAEYGHNHIIELLLKHKANINHSNIDGETALFSAVYGEHINTVRFLLKNSCDATIKNNRGVTAYETAQNKRLKDIAVLIKQSTQY